MGKFGDFMFKTTVGLFVVAGAAGLAYATIPSVQNWTNEHIFGITQKVETPPADNEQPGDNNETPTPDNPGDVGSEIQYTTNTFYFNDINYISLYEDAGIDGWRSLDTSNGLDNIQFVVGERYNIDLQVNSFYAITEVYYDSSLIWNGRWTEDKSILPIYFTAVENGIFQVTTEYVGEIPYTTNTFNMAHCDANLYRDVDGWAYVDVSSGFDNVQIVVGDRYSLHLYPHESYAITEVVYNNERIWAGYHTDIYSAVSPAFTAVENGIFQVTTQAIPCYSVNNLVQCNAADYTCSFRDLNGNQVDTLYGGQDYTFEISINETDRIVTYLESIFFSPSYPNTQTAGATFNMLYDFDSNSPSIWVHTALTTETVNFVMGDITGVSVNITTLEGITPESYYPGIRYQVEIIADADYNVLGFNVGENFTSFEADPLYGGTSRYFEFNIPADATGNVEFSVTTEYIGAE